jgi:hypothetical protein
MCAHFSSIALLAEYRFLAGGGVKLITVTPNFFSLGTTPRVLPRGIHLLPSGIFPRVYGQVSHVSASFHFRQPKDRSLEVELQPKVTAMRRYSYVL